MSNIGSVPPSDNLVNKDKTQPEVNSATPISPEKKSLIDNTEIDTLCDLVDNYYESRIEWPTEVSQLITLIDTLIQQAINNIANDENQHSDFKAQFFSLNGAQALTQQIPNLLQVLDIVERWSEKMRHGLQPFEERQRLIAKLTPLLFKLAVIDERFLKSHENAGRQYIRILYCDLQTIAQDQLIFEAIKSNVSNMLSQLLDQTAISSIGTFFEKHIRAYQTLLKPIKNKSLIFERRTCESELGKAKSWGAKFWATRQITTLIEGHVLPEFVHEMLEEAWIQVVFLERLKKPEIESLKSLQTVKYLIASTKDIYDKKSAARLLFLQKDVRKKIKRTLDEIPGQSNQSEDFIQLLKPVHEQCYLNACERDAYVAPTNNSDVVRLAPAKNATYKATSALRNSTVRPMIQMSPAELEVWVDEVVNSSDFMAGVAHEISDLTQNKEESRLTQMYLSLEKALIPSCWYDILEAGQSLRAKLSTKLIDNDSYVFVNAQGVLTKSIKQNKLLKLFENGELLPVYEFRKSEQLLEAACNDSIATENSRRKKAQLAKIEALESAKQAAEKEKAAQSARQVALARKEKAMSKARQQLMKVEVGEWVEFIEGGVKKRCRIAAIRTSSNDIVFVDRNGFKSAEHDIETLAEMIVDKKLNLMRENELFNLSLR